MSEKNNALVNLRYRDGCEGSPSNPVKFNNQDYTQLKSDHLSKNCLFVDPTFPPNSCSLGDLPYLDDWEEDHLTWLRPADIMKLQNNDKELTFCKDGASYFDSSQGYIHNSWFLAALSSLTFKHSMLERVVPMNQSFLEYDYAGIFHFRIWRFGKWVDVVVDDFLPVFDNQLLSVHSISGNEFWGALLEKAYAKVCGSYAAMQFGTPAETCKDFSGGVSMLYRLSEARDSKKSAEQVWLMLGRVTDAMSLICCSTPQGKDAFVKSINQNGLVDKHAYAVMAVTEVTHLDAKVKLIRLFNPWGTLEWNGKWSDTSDLWDSVSAEDQKKRCNRDDGEFWMELGDFCEFFEMLFISSENPNFIDGDLNCQWNCMIYEGSWVAGKSAGGAMGDTSFETNPQYRIQVTTIDEREPGDQNLMLSLVQKPGPNRRFTRFYPVALTIVKVPPGTPEGWLELPFFYQNEPLKKFDLYAFNRELVEFHSVEPGEYVIVPYAKMKYMAADFVLTVYTKDEAKISVWEKNYTPEGKPAIPVVSIDDKDDFNAMFKRYADQNGELDKTQLQKILNENFPHGSMDGFSLDVCRSMSALVDDDGKMTVTITEFHNLWEKMMGYKKMFHSQDLSKNGTLSEYELKTALEAAEVDVDDSSVKRLMYRYSDKNTTCLKDFIILMIRLEKAAYYFKENEKDGKMEIDKSTFTQMCMYS